MNKDTEDKLEIEEILNIIGEKKKNFCNYALDKFKDYPLVKKEIKKMEVMNESEFYNYARLYLVPFTGRLDILMKAIEHTCEVRMHDIDEEVYDKMKRYYEFFCKIVI